jgi:hypothetical protein
LALGNSLAREIKEQIRDKISALSDVQKCYTFMKLPLEGWPTVFVLYGNIEGEFSSNRENSRVYGYRIIVLYQVGQDFQSVNDDRMQNAEEAIGQVVEQILNSIETDFTLDGFNSEVLFVNALDVTYGETEYEGGYAKSAEFTCNVYTEHGVVS